MSAPRVVALVSGRGSNLGALLDAIDAGRCRAEVVGVLADRACPALERAQARAIAVGVVAPSDHPDRAAWDEALAAAIAELAPDLVVLAGFLRILGEATLAKGGAPVINVHPSLLPAFPGMRAPRQALKAGARVSGCTVHLVDAGVDTGPILAQGALRVRTDDDEASLHRRIQGLEHRLLPAVVDAIATGALELSATPRWRDPWGGSLLEGDG